FPVRFLMRIRKHLITVGKEGLLATSRKVIACHAPSECPPLWALTPRDCTVSIKTFLTQRAVNIAVGGSYTLKNWLDPEGKPRTFACRTSRVSPFRMMVDVPVVGKLGDKIEPYFGDFGKLEGHITDTTPGGFLLE